MPTPKNAGTAATALQLMYYALCVMILCVLATFVLPNVVQNLAQLLTGLRVVSYTLTGTAIGYIAGAFLCLSLSRETQAAAYLVPSLVLWGVALLVSILENVEDVPWWAPFARYALNLVSFVLFLMFLRAVAGILDNRELVSRARNTLQICVGVVVLWAIYFVFLFADARLFFQINTFFGLGLLLATLIAFVMYAKLLIYTSGALRKAKASEIEVEDDPEDWES